MAKNNATMKKSTTSLFNQRLLLILISAVVLHTCILVAGDQQKSVPGLITGLGFNVEVFRVESQNYSLNLYRIVNPLANKSELGPPIVVHHGIDMDPVDMMANSKNARPRKPNRTMRVTLHKQENGSDDSGLHFYLANNGYDVWLIETRGNNGSHSRTQRKNQHRFWDFSLDEQALFDVPNQINFVMDKTQHRKVGYIGFSQSTTFMFMLLSFDPDFADKLITFIALAPVGWSSHMEGAAKDAAKLPDGWILDPSLPVMGVKLRRIFNFFTTYFCAPNIIKYSVCRAAWQYLGGADNDANLENAITENAIKPTSLKGFEHFLLMAHADDLRMYDYKDKVVNMRMYGQPEPPRYVLEHIKLRTIVLFRGLNDYPSDPTDQARFISKLTVPLYEDHVLPSYSHMDMILSKTVVRDINEPVCRVLDRLTNRPVNRIAYSMTDETNQLDAKLEPEYLRNRTLAEAEQYLKHTFQLRAHI